ncbi:MAG: hypothetical protein HIU93_12370 [Acidobacteria bacterium]|nr:hypothetical protein [Acidobacteriota bacterium]
MPTQAASVLTLLIENSGAMVSREDLKALLWPGAEVVDYDQSINRVISQLRSILGERPEKASQFIDTLPKRGYRFKATVTEVSSLSVALQPSQPSQGLQKSELVPIKEAALSVEAVSEPAAVPVDAHTHLLSTTWPPPGHLARDQSISSPRHGASKVLILGVVAALALLACLVVVWRETRTHVEPRAQVLSLGIVPFESYGDQSSSVAESFRLDLADTLAQIPGIEIRAAHAFDHAGSDEATIRSHAIQLGVDALLFGKLTLKDDQCTLQLELVRSKDGVHLDSFHYVGTREELAAIRDHVQRDFFLRLAPTGSTDAVAKISQPSPKAYDAYLRGRFYLSQWTDDSLKNALASFQESLLKEPGYARSYAGEASAYFVLTQHGAIQRDEGIRQARANATEAIKLDPSLAEPYAILGQISISNDWNYSLAEEQLHRAIELDPNHAMYRLWLAILYCEENRFEPALQQIDKAHAADPTWSPVYMTEIYVAGSANEFARANAASLKLNQTMPDWSLAHEQRALLLWNNQRYLDAIAEWRLAAVLEKNTARVTLEDQGLQAFRKGGVPAYARVRLHAIETGQGLSHEDEDFIPAEWHAYAGELDVAMDELEEMVRQHSHDALQIGNDPAYLKLRGTARFDQLIHRIGLPSQATVLKD